MSKLLQIDFPYAGPFGEQLAESMGDVAHSIKEEPGFIWKIWTENEEEKQGGGIYLFDSEESAQTYLNKHTARLNGLGITEINSRLFDVNDVLSTITHGPTR